MKESLTEQVGLVADGMAELISQRHEMQSPVDGCLHELKYARVKEEWAVEERERWNVVEGQVCFKETHTWQLKVGLSYLYMDRRDAPAVGVARGQKRIHEVESLASIAVISTFVPFVPSYSGHQLDRHWYAGRVLPRSRISLMLVAR